MKIHVCLVSGQLIPNVLPALKEKPERIVLLVTPKKRDNAGILQQFFQSRNFHVKQLELADGYDFTNALQTCEKVVKEYGPENELTLNVTGGTKIIMLAAYQAFYFAQPSRRIIYMDTENNRLLTLGDQPAEAPLAENLLKVKEYLALYGKHFTPRQSDHSVDVAQKRRELTARFGAMLLDHPEALPGLNFRLSQFDGKTPPFSVELGNLPGLTERQNDELLALLAGDGGNGLIQPVASGGRVSIPDENAFFYLHGGWLEEYVLNAVRAMNVPGLDCRMNVNIEWRENAAAWGQSTRNELDVVFTHQNRLHILSCKTAQLGKSDGVKGKDALYELDSLQKSAGGLFARAMLVSALKPDAATLRRANDQKIEVVSGRDIRNLATHLKRLKWV